MRSAALLASIGEMQGYRNRLCARKGQLDPDVDEAPGQQT